MKRPRRYFSSWLARHFDRFVELKRAGGASYISQKTLLLAFDHYLFTEATQPPLSREVIIRYLGSFTWSPRARDNVVSVVWQALSYARRLGADIETLPERPPRPPSHWRQRPPRIVSTQEVAELIAAARALSPNHKLRPATVAALIGLLYTTGLRIGEALALDVGNLDRRDGILTVIRGKFGKSRALPLRNSTIQALVGYIEDSRRPITAGPTAPIFVSDLRRRLAMPTVHQAFRATCQAAKIRQPWPRPHDLRHTFAVKRVASWYAERRNVDCLLPVLSTYLGHCSIEGTRRYLTQNGALLEHAASRFECQTTVLDEIPT